MSGTSSHRFGSQKTGTGGFGLIVAAQKASELGLRWIVESIAELLCLWLAPALIANHGRPEASQALKGDLWIMETP
jgi:hypothetical protein